MSYVKIIGAAVCAAVFALLLKEQKSPFGQLLSAVLCVALSVSAVNEFGDSLSEVADVFSGDGFNGYTKTLAKALGVSLLCEWSGDICKDLGERTLASRIELAGKAEILVLSLPLIAELLETARVLAA